MNKHCGAEFTKDGCSWGWLGRHPHRCDKYEGHDGDHSCCCRTQWSRKSA